MKKLFLIAALIVALTIPFAGRAAELNNITSAGVDGNLVFYDKSGNIINKWNATDREISIPSGSKIAVESGGQITEESGGAILGRAVLNAYAADVGTAGSYWVVSPFAGTIVNMAAVNYVANTTTKTVLTVEIAGTLVTAAAWEIAVTAAAGTVTAVVPTATHTVTAGQAIEIISDGGSATASQATMFSITILRTS